MFPQATSRRRQGFLDAMNGGNATATGGFGGQGSAAAYPQSFAPQADPSQVRDPNGNQVFSGPLAGPSQTSGPITPVAGRPFLLGFETSKLLDPNKGPGDSGKYSAAAKAFGQAYLGGTDIGRGNLEPMLNAVKAQFPNARIVGDDKIDFGDGYGPVDVIRSDGSVVFQNTTGNPNYERAYARGQQGALGLHGGAATYPQSLTGAPTNTGPMAPNPSGAGPVPVAAGDWGALGITPAQATPGMAIPGIPGKVLQHSNGGWQIVDSSATAQAQTTEPGAPPTAPQATGPSEPLPDYAPTPIDIPEQLQLERIAASQPFVAPTAEEAAADRGYQFALRQGSDALQNSAAARGLLRSGGTLKDLMAYNRDAASQQYDKVYGRRYGEYTTDLANRLAIGQANNAAAAQGYGLTNQFRQAAQGANNANALGAYQANVAARLGYGNLANEQTQTANAFTLGQGNLALGNRQADISREIGLGNIGVANRNADISRELGLGNIGLGYYQAGNAYNLGQGNLGLGWANYGLNADQQNFGQGYALANMGLSAAGSYGNAAGQYGANAGNYATQAGNAGAAGQVGSANAWAQGLGGIAAGVGGGLYGSSYYRG